MRSEGNVSGSPRLTGPAAWHRVAVEWFSELFAPDDHATVVLRNRGAGGGVVQRTRAVSYWCHPTGQRMLRQANDAGSDVFCSVNPMEPGSSRSVAEVRRLQLDFDAEGDRHVGRLMRDVRAERVPMPAVVVRSSVGRWQVLWHVDPAVWTRAGAEEVNRRLAAAYQGDPAVVDVTRVMRVPGFVNRKPGRGGVRVALVGRHVYDRAGAGSQWWEPRAFRSVMPAGRVSVSAPAQRSAPAGAAPARRYLYGRIVPASQSEADWARVVDALRAGESPGVLIQELAEFREDKADPRDYAERTVVRACRSLGLEEPRTEYGRRHPPPALDVAR